MDSRRVIAARIDMGLRRALGEGVDAQRTLDDPLYARDVLLVCDAMTGTDLPELARRFRAATLGGRDAGPPQEWAADTSGFGLSTPPPVPVPSVQAPAEAPPAAPWYSPRRWFS
jgi:hypothetical protein